MPGMSRRNALRMLGGLAAVPYAPMAFAAGPAHKKFVFVILRGAMDGLAALIPHAPELESLRGGLAAPESDRRPVNSDFSLHPAFESVHGMVKAGEAAFVHACSTPYRQRSHFDGQDVLETLGGSNPHEGWLNRALQVARGLDGLAIDAAIPLVLEGKAQATNWSPSFFAVPGDDLLDRLAHLYAQADPSLGAALETARTTDARAGAMTGERIAGAIPYAAYLHAAGRLMAAEGGPGIGVVSLNGWDTHANQARKLDASFAALDKGFAELKTQLGTAWAQTVVVAASEFGRTVAENGTRGSDHGTGGLAILAGGAVNGGRVFGDWPGLGAKDLYQARDLMPANDMTAVFKGVLRDHLGLDSGDLDKKLFPGSGTAMADLVRT